MYFYCINNNLYNIKFNEKFVEKNKKKKIISSIIQIQVNIIKQ